MVNKGSWITQLNKKHFDKKSIILFALVEVELCFFLDKLKKKVRLNEA